MVNDIFSYADINYLSAYIYKQIDKVVQYKQLKLNNPNTIHDLLSNEYILLYNIADYYNTAKITNISNLNKESNNSNNAYYYNVNNFMVYKKEIKYMQYKKAEYIDFIQEYNSVNKLQKLHNELLDFYDKELYKDNIYANIDLKTSLNIIHLLEYNKLLDIYNNNELFIQFLNQNVININNYPIAYITYPDSLNKPSYILQQDNINLLQEKFKFNIEITNEMLKIDIANSIFSRSINQIALLQSIYLLPLGSELLVIIKPVDLVKIVYFNYLFYYVLL